MGSLHLNGFSGNRSMKGKEMNSKNLTRRQFMKRSAVLGAAGFISSTAFCGRESYMSEEEISDLKKYDIIIPRVKFRTDDRMRDKWNVLPVGEHNLLSAFEEVVRCKVKKHPGLSNGQTLGREDQFNSVVAFWEYEKLRQYPFVFMTSDGYFRFDDMEKKNLKRYIDQGGFILFDDCVENTNGYHDYFFQSAITLMQEVFGQDAIQKVPLDHEIFHNVYDMKDKGMPFIQGVNHGAYALFTEGRIAALMTPGDIHCGWVDKDYSWYGPNGRGPGCDNHDKTIEAGINILMYVMTH